MAIAYELWEEYHPNGNRASNPFFPAAARKIMARTLNETAVLLETKKFSSWYEVKTWLHERLGFEPFVPDEHDEDIVFP